MFLAKSFFHEITKTSLKICSIQKFHVWYYIIYQPSSPPWKLPSYKEKKIKLICAGNFFFSDFISAFIFLITKRKLCKLSPLENISNRFSRLANEYWKTITEYYVGTWWEYWWGWRRKAPKFFFPFFHQRSKFSCVF